MFILPLGGHGIGFIVRRTRCATRGIGIKSVEPREPTSMSTIPYVFGDHTGHACLVLLTFLP